MTHTNPRRAGWRVAAAATVGALVVALGFATSASAAVTIPDPAAEGSLTIHKLVNPTAAGSPANGLEQTLDATYGTGLNGVEFQIQEITTVDLQTTAGWQAAADYAQDPSTIDAADLGAPVTGTTATVAGEDGVLVFDPLTVGAYLVTENLTAAQIEDGITGADPFVVTIPMTHPVDLDEWVYDVHVYPKNLSTEPVKTVNDGPGTTYEVGDQIEWTISAAVPAQDTTFYAFKDELSEHTEIPGADAAEIASNVAVNIGATALTSGTDYTVYYPLTLAQLQTIDPTATAVADNTLLVVLTASGLTALNAVAATDEVSVTFNTEVVSLPTDGIIANTGVVFPNDSYPLSGPGVPTEEVESKFGEIIIDKFVNGSDVATSPLAGAEFKVFASEADAIAYAADPTAAANAELPLEAYENAGTTLTDTFTTDADGQVRIFGLRASNWQDGAELTNPADFQNYWVVETKAPAGYELSTAPFGPISVLWNANEPAELPTASLDVPNVPKTELPFTGGTLATWAFYLAGGALLIGGALFAIRARLRGARNS